MLWDHRMEPQGRMLNLRKGLPSLFVAALGSLRWCGGFLCWSSSWWFSVLPSSSRSKICIEHVSDGASVGEGVRGGGGSLKGLTSGIWLPVIDLWTKGDDTMRYGAQWLSLENPLHIWSPPLKSINQYWLQLDQWIDLSNKAAWRSNAVSLYAFMTRHLCPFQCRPILPFRMTISKYKLCQVYRDVSYHDGYIHEPTTVHLIEPQSYSWSARSWYRFHLYKCSQVPSGQQPMHSRCESLHSLSSFCCRDISVTQPSVQSIWQSSNDYKYTETGDVYDVW